jgi:RNA polymerase sigma-70 factor (ECF subfamily)
MGATPARDAVLTAYVQSLIQFKARQICKKPGFSRSDQEDLAQELILRLLEKVPQYDPGRCASLDTFANRVVESSVKMILRDRRRLKRSAEFTALSLDMPLGSMPLPLGSALGEDDEHRRGASKLRPEEIEDAEAFAHALRQMPANLAEVARRLMQSNVASVARDLGTSRSRIYSDIAKIRDYFKQSGFSASAQTPAPAAAYISPARNKQRSKP